VLYGIAAAILFGINASTTKVIITAGVTPEQVVLFRSFSAGLVAFIWALWANRAALKVPARLIPRLVIMGIIGVGLLQWNYSQAVYYLPIGIALLLEYTAVLWVPLIAMLIFREKVNSKIWLGAVLVLGGLAIVAQIWATDLNPVGIFFGFAASASLTVHFIMGERVQRYLPTNVVMTYGMGVATLFFLPFSNLGQFDFSSLGAATDLSGNLAGIEVPLWFALLFMGLFGSFAPMALVYLSLRHLSATLVGVVATSETVLAALFALIWLGEKLNTTQLLGGIVVITGILIAQTARNQKAVKVVD